MNSGAISITSTRWRIRSIRNYPQDLQGQGRSAQPAALPGERRPTIQTVDPRWGKIGKQKITDEGPLPPHPIDGIKYNMETVDEVIRDKTIDFIDKAKGDGKPFFVWHNPTRMHVVTHLSPKYEAMRNAENGWSIEEAGMAQLDDSSARSCSISKDHGLDDNTIVVFTTDNGAENFTWPDGGQTPFAGGKGTALEGGFRVPCILRWPGKVPAGQDRQQHHLRARLVPDFRRGGRQSEHRRGADRRQGSRRHDLQGASRRLQPARLHHRQGAVEAQRDLLLHRDHARRGAHRRLQIPLHRSAGRLARQYRQGRLADPDQSPARSVRAHRHAGASMVRRRTGTPTSSGASSSCSRRWRSSAQSFIDFPPMQKAASFNLEAVKEQIEGASRRGKASRHSHVRRQRLWRLARISAEAQPWSAATSSPSSLLPASSRRA